jgi:hypothetical protein
VVRGSSSNADSLVSGCMLKPGTNGCAGAR